MFHPSNPLLPAIASFTALLPEWSALVKSAFHFHRAGRRPCHVNRQLHPWPQCDCRSSNGWASSHVALDVFRRITNGFAAALDILAGSVHRVAAEQPGDRHKYQQRNELFHIRFLQLQVE
jgi:hypothetical protein